MSDHEPEPPVEQRVRITIEGGVVALVEANFPGLNVLVYDVDAETAGDEPRTNLTAECHIEDDHEADWPFPDEDTEEDWARYREEEGLPPLDNDV